MERLESLETGERRNDIFIAGNTIPVSNVTENTTAVVTSVLKAKLNYELPAEAVLSTKRVGKPPAAGQPDKRKILLKLASEPIRDDLLNSCKRVKPPGLFLNDNLIPTRAEILYCLRKLKMRCPDKIEHCGSFHGKVYLWLKAGGRRSASKKLFINSFSALEDFCSVELSVDLTEIRHQDGNAS